MQKHYATTHILFNYFHLFAFYVDDEFVTQMDWPFYLGLTSYFNIFNYNILNGFCYSLKWWAFFYTAEYIHIFFY